MPQPTVPLEVVVRSNEKLVKALITLLSLKDPHLLGELKTIFTLASRGGSEIGEAAPAVWEEVERELAMIEGLLTGEGDDDQAVALQTIKRTDGSH